MLKKIFSHHSIASNHSIKAQAWAYDRFGPSIATAVRPIIGYSDDVSQITYHGGCYAKAICFEPVIIPAGTRVRVIGKVEGVNIWLVEPLSQVSIESAPVPNKYWAEKYFDKDKRRMRRHSVA